MSDIKKYDLADVIRSHLELALRQTYTMLPATVNSYDSEKQVCEIIISVSERVRDDLVIPSAIMRNVPVIFPYGDNFSMSWNLKKGDNVMCVFSMRDLSLFHNTDGKKATEAPSKRRHDPSDVYVISGLTPRSKPRRNETYKDKAALQDEKTIVSFNRDGTDGLTIESDKDVHVITTANLVAEAVDVDLTATGNVDATISGTLEADVTGNTTLTTPTLIVNGNMQVNGTFDATGVITSDVDCVSDTISGKSHTHTVPAHSNTPTTAPV